MSAQVEFEAASGTVYGTTEEFPLNGGDKVVCLVMQPASGEAPTRVPFESDEADRLRKRFPELAKVSKPGKAEAAPAKGKK